MTVAPPGLVRWNRIGLAGAAAVGALDAWFYRNWDANPDGVSYLDMARAFATDGIGALINGYWSPLYPGLLGVAMKFTGADPATNYLTARAVGFVVYMLAALAWFRLVRVTLAETEWPQGTVRHAPAVAIAIAWALFFMLVSQATGLHLMTPDIGVAAVVFVAVGELIALHRFGLGQAHWLRLGTLLGLGYWWKAILFPVAGVILLAATAMAWRPRDAWRDPLLSWAVFAALAVSLMIPLSRHTGRVTFGETGRLNQLWYVNRAPMVEWLCMSSTGNLQNPRAGVARAEPVLTEQPLLCGTDETTPWATLPIWYDPSPWYRDSREYLDLGETARAIVRNAEYVREAMVIWAPLTGVALLLLGAAMLAAGVTALRTRRDSAAIGLFEPALIAMVGGIPILEYLLVYVELRHVVPFILCIAVAALLTLPRLGARARNGVLLAAAALIAADTAYRIGTQQRVEAAITVHEWRGLSRPKQRSEVVANGLRGAGLGDGDRVAAVNAYWNPEWAQRAGLRIRAYTPVLTYPIDRIVASLTDPCEFARVADLLRQREIRAIVAKEAPAYPLPAHFRRIEDTGFAVATLDGAGLPPTCAAPTRSSSGTGGR